ncbi:MAG: lysophospholipid acyltransferase family protein [Planctomycetota bacterium]
MPTAKPSPPDALPGRNDWLFGWFSWYVRRFVRKHFNAVRILGDHPLDDPAIVGPDRPLIVYLNHPGWWDPMMAVYLADRFMRDRPHGAPIDAEALEKYAVFRHLGFFGVEPSSATGGRVFLRSASACLDHGWALWVTAQGEFTDPRQRPIELMPGLAHLVRRRARQAADSDDPHAAGHVLPVAIEYPFWTERTPEALLHVGEPMPIAGFADAPVEASHERLCVALGDAMDRLAEAAIARDLESLRVVAQGQANVGGVYDLWRRITATLKGQRFDPAHRLDRRQRPA